MPEDLSENSPLEIAPLPPYLKAIRAASAYSFTPGHPTHKGTFYVVPREGPWIDNREELAEYRMLSAHETWPGHHLLDSWRWHHAPPLRRPLEFPLFYEGWACFAEEMMRLTGYFSEPRVITSYSIHYTKLYDADLPFRPERASPPSSPPRGEDGKRGGGGAPGSSLRSVILKRGGCDMWLRWFPWRVLVSRAAQARGLIGPVKVLARLENFAQPLEGKVSLERIRAGREDRNNFV